MEQNKTPTEETEVKQPEAEAVEETAAETETVSEASDAIADLQAKLDALNDKHLRMAEAVAYTVKALLPTYDNLERALKAETADAEYKKGVELTMTQLVESLKGIGVEKIAAEPGTAFDPNLMNAVMHIENEELGENVIAEVFQQGFQIGDKVIRHAMVQVAN